MEEVTSAMNSKELQRRGESSDATEALVVRGSQDLEEQKVQGSQDPSQDPNSSALYVTLTNT
jgi:hypothetical protein